MSADSLVTATGFWDGVKAPRLFHGIRVRSPHAGGVVPDSTATSVSGDVDKGCIVSPKVRPWSPGLSVISSPGLLMGPVPELQPAVTPVARRAVRAAVRKACLTKKRVRKRGNNPGLGEVDKIRLNSSESISASQQCQQ